MATINISTVNENMQLMAEELRKQLGIDYTPDKRSAWYMLMFPIARLLREKEERQQYQADKMNLFKCEGQEIDNMLAGSPFFFQRKQESKATVDIKLIGGTGVQLYLGDVIVEAKDGTTYRLAEEKVLNTETSFLFECETSGSIGNKDVTEIVKLKKIVNGVYDFSQVDASTGGQETETDNDYIQRWLLSRQDSVWNLDGIYSEVLSVDGVKSVYADRNVEMTTSTNGLPPKSISVVVDGGSDLEVANAIWKKHDPAIKTFGDTCVDIVDIQGIQREVCFFRPTKKQIEFNIEYTVKDGVSIAYTELEILVKEYINSVKVGNYITSYQCESEFVRPIYDTSKLLNIDVTYRFEGDTTYKKVIKLGFSEVGYVL